MKRLQVKKKLLILFFLPSLLGVCIFTIVPLLITLYDSIVQHNSSQWINFRNYADVIKNSAYQLALKNTIIFTIINIFIVLSFGLCIARVLSGLKSGKIVSILFSIPMIIPSVSVTLLFKLMFDYKGIVNRGLVLLNVREISWFNSNYATLILTLMFVWKNIGFNILIWVLSIQSIPSSIKEAAKVDGADDHAIFKYIVFPNLANALLLNLVILVINVQKIFREAYLIGGDYPHESIYMLQHLFNNWFREYDFINIACGGIVYIILVGSFIIGISLAAKTVRKRGGL